MRGRRQSAFVQRLGDGWGFVEYRRLSEKDRFGVMGPDGFEVLGEMG